MSDHNDRLKSRHQSPRVNGMSARYPVHTLYVGSPDGAPFRAAERGVVVETASSCFAGFTINDAEGFFEGRPVATLIIRIATGDTPVVEEMARSIGRKLGQRKVGLEVKGLYQSIPMG
jgi:hypothetical protein